MLFEVEAVNGFLKSALVYYLISMDGANTFEVFVENKD